MLAFSGAFDFSGIRVDFKYPPCLFIVYTRTPLKRCTIQFKLRVDYYNT